MDISHLSKNYQEVKGLNQLRIGSIILIVSFCILVFSTIVGFFFHDIQIRTCATRATCNSVNPRKQRRILKEGCFFLSSAYQVYQ